VAADHTLVATVANPAVVVATPSVNIDGLLAFIIEPIIQGQVDGLVPTLQQQFEDQLGTVLGPLLSDGLGALALDVTFSLPRLDGSGTTIDINLVTDFQSTDFRPDGGAFLERAGAYTTPTVTPYDNLGIPDRANCGAPPQTLIVPRAAPFEIVLADDTLNQILYAGWLGGLLDFPVPASLLGGVDLTQYGISNMTLTLSGMLAPTAADCNAAGELIAHIGDVRIDAALTILGQQLDLVIWATFGAGVTLAADPAGLGITISDIKYVETEVNVVQPDKISFEPVVQDLIEQQLIGGLLSALGGGALGAIPLPTMDLGPAVGLPPGQAVISINPTGVTRDSGNTIVSGTL
jgi:hypothetical protein